MCAYPLRQKGGRKTAKLRALPAVEVPAEMPILYVHPKIASIHSKSNVLECSGAVDKTVIWSLNVCAHPRDSWDGQRKRSWGWCRPSRWTLPRYHATVVYDPFRHVFESQFAQICGQIDFQSQLASGIRTIILLVV